MIKESLVQREGWNLEAWRYTDAYSCDSSQHSRLTHEMNGLISSPETMNEYLTVAANIDYR
ncbi:hypothetical protein KTT_58220 [Tengunoibacter tsumagoiensis]|uniref:Uncharacterized protein n=1 Tax=Tengunoibacter tsumagoiensis TaxID=2014871 RepID=A0A402A9X8_9CHLR|nr:hypothetical protein KTT_58220 [Tengunoibacter tsumagoiensis]